MFSLQGRSRSAAIVIAYIMFKLSISYDEALAMMQKLRPIVLPNNGFAKQLLEFEEELKMNRIRKTNPVESFKLYEGSSSIELE